MKMDNACISFPNFLYCMQKKAKCENSNYFKSESDLIISFSKKREGRKHSTILFLKGEKTLRLF